MGSSTKANGSALIGMGMEFSIGQMALSIKATGRRIKPAGKESLPTLMGILTKGIGETIRPMASEYTSMPDPRQSMKDTGKMI